MTSKTSVFFLLLMSLFLAPAQVLACSLSSWSNVSGSVAAIPGANYSGTCGMRATVNSQPAYVEDTTPGIYGDVNEYVARFYVDTENLSLGADTHSLELFSAYDASNTTLFTVNLSTNGGSPVIYARLANSNDTKDLPLGPGWRAILVHWKAGTNGSLTLEIDGLSRDTVSADTAGALLDHVRLGAPGGDLTAFSNTADYDNFTAARIEGPSTALVQCTDPQVSAFTFPPGADCIASTALKFTGKVVMDPGTDEHVIDASTVSFAGVLRVLDGAKLRIK